MVETGRPKPGGQGYLSGLFLCTAARFCHHAGVAEDQGLEAARYDQGAPKSSAQSFRSTIFHILFIELHILKLNSLYAVPGM